MNCPHCQKPLPENYSASYCLYCGQAVQYQVPIPVVTVEPSPPRPPFKINWLIFYAVLFAPPLLTMLSAFLHKGQANESVSPDVALDCGAVAGIICGVILGLDGGKSVAAKIVFSILLSFIFTFVCVALSFGGRIAGQYHFRFQ